MGQFKKALDLLKEAEARNPKDRDTHHSLAMFYLKLNRHEDALRPPWTGPLV